MSMCFKFSISFNSLKVLTSNNNCWKLQSPTVKFLEHLFGFAHSLVLRIGPCTVYIVQNDLQNNRRRICFDEINVVNTSSDCTHNKLQVRMKKGARRWSNHNMRWLKSSLFICWSCHVGCNRCLWYHMVWHLFFRHNGHDLNCTCALLSFALQIFWLSFSLIFQCILQGMHFQGLWFRMREGPPGEKMLPPRKCQSLSTELPLMIKCNCCNNVSTFLSETFVFCIFLSNSCPIEKFHKLDQIR